MLRLYLHAVRRAFTNRPPKTSNCLQLIRIVTNADGILFRARRRLSACLLVKLRRFVRRMITKMRRACQARDGRPGRGVEWVTLTWEGGSGVPSGGYAGPPLRPRRIRKCRVFQGRVDRRRRSRQATSGVPYKFPTLFVGPRRASNGRRCRRRCNGFSSEHQYVNGRRHVGASTRRGMNRYACAQRRCRTQRSLPVGRRRGYEMRRYQAHLPL